MIIATAKEIDPGEPRVAASPETVKKFKALGTEVAVEPGVGLKSGLLDSDSTAVGATASTDAVKDADIVIKVRRPEACELKQYKRGALVIAINTVMLLGDAKKMTESIVKAIWAQVPLVK